MSSNVLSGTVAGPSGFLNNASVDAWLASRFTSVPSAGTPPPAGSADAGPIASGPQFGGPGQWQLAVGSVSAYYIRVVYNNQSYWSYDDSLVLTTGPQGPTGATGSAGATGATGTAATITVGSTTTGAAGTSASVSNSGTSSAAVLNFTVPKGDTGATGATGATGSQGNQGIYIQSTSSSVPTTSLWADTSTSGSAVIPVGGTTGQVLNKTSSTDYDTSWVTPTSTYVSVPSINNQIAWTMDPVYVGVQTNLTSVVGIAQYLKIYLQAGMVLTNVCVYVNTAGVGIANSYIGLYNATTQLAVTSVITTAFQSAGFVQTPFATAYTIPTSGFYFIGVLIGNGSTTQPRFATSASYNFTNSSMLNAGLTPTSNTLTLRSSTLGTGLTALPSSISGTPTGTNSATFWVALN